MKNIKVAVFKRNLIINDKLFLKRVAYFQDKGFEGTVLKNVICTNLHFVTLNNKRKYSFNSSYYDDDKSVSELTALFNTIWAQFPLLINFKIMKKPILIILSIIIYIISFWLLTGVFVGINLAVLGRGIGGITAFGGIISLWLSYKIVKWLWKKYFSKTKT